MKWIAALFFLFCGTVAMAAGASIPSSQAGRIYAGVGAGAGFSKITNSNYVGSGAGWPNDYYGVSSISNSYYGFLAGGYAWSRDTTWFPYYSVGLRYAYIPGTTTDGNINQYSLSGFQNYNYRYDVQILDVLATLKVNLVRWQRFMPYISLGAGVANYNTTNYKEVATEGVTPRVSPGFQSYASTNFTYSIGLGVDYILQDNLWIDLEYDYNNFGRIRTGYGENTATLTGTNYDNEFLRNDLTSNTLFLGVTFYA